MNTRVAVTGVGVVSPIGTGKEAFWESLIPGRSGVGLVTHFDASSYPCQYAAEVNDFQATDFISPKAPAVYPVALSLQSFPPKKRSKMRTST